MVRRRPCAVSNHEDNERILRDAHKSALLRMRIEFVKSDVAREKGVTNNA